MWSNGQGIWFLKDLDIFYRELSQVCFFLILMLPDHPWWVRLNLFKARSFINFYICFQTTFQKSSETVAFQFPKIIFSIHNNEMQSKMMNNFPTKVIFRKCEKRHLYFWNSTINLFLLNVRFCLWVFCLILFPKHKWSINYLPFQGYTKFSCFLCLQILKLCNEQGH